MVVLIAQVGIAAASDTVLTYQHLRIVEPATTVVGRGGQMHTRLVGSQVPVRQVHRLNVLLLQVFDKAQVAAVHHVVVAARHVLLKEMVVVLD